MTKKLSFREKLHLFTVKAKIFITKIYWKIKLRNVLILSFFSNKNSVTLMDILLPKEKYATPEQKQAGIYTFADILSEDIEDIRETESRSPEEVLKEFFMEAGSIPTK